MAPRSIEQTEWLSHAISEMRRVCASMQPSSAEADAEAIRLIASRIQLAADMYEKSLAGLYPEGEFHGESVTGSRTATVAGIRHMDSSASVGIKIADQISAIAGILSSTQGSVADVEGEFGETVGAAERVLLHSRLAKTMSDTYSNPVIGANGSLPEYDVAPLPQLGSGFEATHFQSTSGGGSGGGSGDNSPALLGSAAVGGANGPDGPAGPGGPGAAQTMYGGEQAADTPFTLGSGDQTSSGGDDSSPGPLNGAFGTPIAGGTAATVPSSASTANGGRAGLPGTGTGSGSGGSGSGRSGAVGGGLGSEAGPLGRRTPASLVTPTPGTGQAGGATPSAASRGGTPMGPAAGGRGAGKDQDGRHRAPSYLHTRENGDELVGRLPLVGPPVLGDWARVVDLSSTGENPAGDTTPTDTRGSTGRDNPDNPDNSSGNRM